jgi:hypothetical protein
MPLVMSATIGKLAEALASAQSEMNPAKKNATNPHFRSTYADLASLHDASRAALGKHGLAVVQLPGRRDDGTTTVTTMLMHASGEFVGDESGVRLSAETAQAAGSVISYLRRYAYAAVLGLSAEDDDGAAASQPVRREERPAERTAERPASAELRVVAPVEASPANDRNDPPCPICGGAMWDNRPKKASGAMNVKAPDFKCKDKTGCEGVIWPPRSGGAKPRVQAASPPPPPPPGDDDNFEIPF